MTIWGRKAGYTFLISSIFVGMDIKRYVLQSLILSSKMMPISTHLEKKKKTLLQAFFITKGHLRWSTLILAKNAFYKCFLEL